ncbi:MAG: PAS domain-containing protein, partial [Bacteroidota bacterium]|nr:PAS domain-containing protein [Bacteroidota bacterium]
MPQHAIDADIIDFILPPENIPGKLLELQQSLITSPSGGGMLKEKSDEEVFQQILGFLKIRVNVDFTFYKQTTLRRRIVRRMLILRLDTLNAYLKYLENDKTELDLLFQDLLIPVTSFFRDSVTYEVLCSEVIPGLLKDKSATNPLRIWIAGCSTGQEAYSIAMCLDQYIGDMHPVKVQIFATDLSEKSINKARTGIYTKKEMDGVSEGQVKEFFNRIDGTYQVKRKIRDMCIFAVQNFLKDPPFAKLDLITCRNVLIYFEPFLQKKAFSIFHYALNNKGILWLGKSETAGQSSDLFMTLGKDKFYIRKQGAGKFMSVATERSEVAYSDRNFRLANTEGKAVDFQKGADDILLSKSPPGVVVNDQFDIVQFRGLTGAFLEPLPGKPSLNVLKMAKEGLGFEIRNALHKVKTSKKPVLKAHILIDDGKTQAAIEVIPILNTVDLHYLILFRKEEPASGNGQGLPVDTEASRSTQQVNADNKDAKDKRIKQLEQEIALAREDMRNITEDQEATNEELQSSNEELLSGSEELQTLNEELETGKEELQSTNEELITVNQELIDRNEQLNQVRNFSEATISILHEPLLVLDKNYRIISANKSFYISFKITEEETLHKNLFELHDNGWDIPGLRKELIKIQKGKEKKIETEINYTFPVIGERIIHFNIQPIQRENGEKLILLALDDITERQRLSALLSEQLLERKHGEINLRL